MRERWGWVKDIWRQGRVPFRDRLIGSFVVLFGFYSCYCDYNWMPLAYRNTHEYYSDGMRGQAFDVLSYKGFKWGVFSDGNL